MVSRSFTVQMASPRPNLSTRPQEHAASFVSSPACFPFLLTHFSSFSLCFSQMGFACVEAIPSGYTRAKGADDSNPAGARGEGRRVKVGLVKVVQVMHVVEVVMVLVK
jgi:hypothetical protein